MSSTAQSWVAKDIELIGWNKDHAKMGITHVMNEGMHNIERLPEYVYQRRNILHWRLILAHREMVGRPGVVRVSRREGVVVDMVKTRGDPIVNVEVKYIEHDVSMDSVDHRMFAALRQGVTVGDILKLLRDRGSTRYRYDDHWGGYLYWLDEMVATIRSTSTTVWVLNDQGTFF